MPKINVYVPDDLAADITRHKDTIQVSAVCQNALREEISMIETTADTEYEVYELDLEDDEGRPLVGRLTAKALAEDVYLTENGNIVLHDRDHGRVENLYAEDLQNVLNEADYIEVANALGMTPKVDLGL